MKHYLSLSKVYTHVYLSIYYICVIYAIYNLYKHVYNIQVHSRNITRDVTKNFFKNVLRSECSKI